MPRVSASLSAVDGMLRPLSPAAFEPVGAARIAREETFGPVVRVVNIANDEDGIRPANDSQRGLGASVWSRDRLRAGRVAARLEAGSAWTNGHACSHGVFQAPRGGRTQSGLGRTHSTHGLYALSHLKDADAGRFTPAWWYPYNERAGLGAPARHRRGLAVLGRRVLGR